MNKKIITSLLVIIIITSFILTPIEMNRGGIDTAKQLVLAALKPDLSHIHEAMIAAGITIAYAGAAVSLAIIIALLMSFLSSGILTNNPVISTILQRLFGGLRAIHELIWALFLVTVFGLKPMSAVLALTLPFIGMLGKVFHDIFVQIDTEDIEYLKISGASKFQQLLYGYLPIALPQLISYSLYRFECAIRSSTILSFVGIGGIGLKISLMLGDLRYNEMFTYIYILVLLIGLIELWSNKGRTSENYSKTICLGLLISLFSWLFILFFEGAIYDQLLNQKNFFYAIDFIKKLLGISSEAIAFFDGIEIKKVLFLTLQTLQMSIVAITMAAVMMFLSVIANSKSFSHPIIYFISRGILLFTRAIPELIWAMILVFIFKPSIWAGALALAIHNYGILTKLCAEVVESMDKKPLIGIKNSGGQQLQLLIYGVLPAVTKRFISYIIYRWEIILRTTIIVGMVGAGGLGYYFKLHFSLFHYTHVTLVIITYLILVRFADGISLKLTHLNRNKSHLAN